MATSRKWRRPDRKLPVFFLIFTPKPSLNHLKSTMRPLFILIFNCFTPKRSKTALFCPKPPIPLLLAPPPRRCEAPEVPRPPTGSEAAAMGSSKKHRERGGGGSEGPEEAPAAAPGGAQAPASPPAPAAAARGSREHRKRRRRASGERRGKRSRSRGPERGGNGANGANGAAGSGPAAPRRPEDTARGGHGRGAAAAEGERRGKRERRDERDEPGKSDSSGGLSVEETNKLRAKLGLKPLDTAPAKKAEAGTKEEPLVGAIVNPLLGRHRDELREKLAAAKEKRLLNQKLGRVRPLGQEEPWLDDAAAWIERSRRLQHERELAHRR
ncbi:U4/U6.U5 tri-snRNP-associated protein 1, partial [Colius striatus]|uniref:U4/U6.U5 tri-snRNP-associated protein 1 n=1 Tax=Colius striatus TaxID=57412 RepID=UPI002B1E3C95